MITYMNDTTAQGYQPGTCNIGAAEIRRRRQVGYLGLIAAAALAAVLLLTDAPAVGRLLVALPLAGAASGFLQARLRFCAGFGMAGLRNLGALGEEERVEDASARARDRRRALQIFGASAAIGALGGLSFAVLPI